MAGFSGFQNDFDGLTVPHLADQDHFRRLPHSGPQSMGKARRVAVQFPLMNGGTFVVVQELDRIFDGDDVVILFAIDAVEQHGKRRRLARSSRAGDQHDSIPQLCDVGKLLRQAQGSEIGDFRRDDAHHDRATSPLNKNVDAKARQAGQSIRDVASSMFAQAW